MYIQSNKTNINICCSLAPNWIRKCGNFKLWFCRGRRGIVAKYMQVMQHVQLAYFSLLAFGQMKVNPLEQTLSAFPPFVLTLIPAVQSELSQKFSRHRPLLSPFLLSFVPILCFCLSYLGRFLTPPLLKRLRYVCYFNIPGVGCK